MKLTLLHILSFGGLNNYDIRLYDGVNVLLGPNESGKSSVAMFIKFIFYGLSSKAARGEASERDRYVSRLTGQAAGYLLLETDGGTEYRVERAILTSDNAPARERVRIINRATGETVTGQNPGEYFFGIGEDVFMNTCFVGQTAGDTPKPRPQALENLLTSADENVDIQKAVRTLDNVRREICRRNGSGELDELRARRDALAAEMEDTAGTSAEILRVRTSLNDIGKRIGELEAERQTCDGILSALDKIRLRRTVEKAEQTEKSIAALRTTLADLDASPLGAGFAEAVDEAEADIRRYADACAAYGASDGTSGAFPETGDIELPETLPFGEELPETAETAETEENPADAARRLDSSAHNQFTAAVVLFLAGLFGFAASLLMYWLGTDAYLLPLIMTLAFVTLGVIFILLHTRSSAALVRLLNDWNAASVEELEQLFADPDELPEEEPSGEEFLPEESPDEEPEEEEPTPSDNSGFPALRERFEAAVANVSRLCETAGISAGEDLTGTLNALRAAADDIRRDREAMAEKLYSLTGKLEALNEQLAGVDRLQAEADYAEIRRQPSGKTAESLTDDEIKSLRKERDFTAAALASAKQRRHDLETQLAALGTPAHTPDEAATALDELDRRIEELSLRHDACELAKTALLEAGEAMRSGVIPKIAENASILLSGATSGTHETLTLDGSWSAGCSTETDTLAADHLSRGTSDLAYLALRIALAEEIFKNESPFLLFDESFSHIDVSRIRGIVSLLLDGQHLILTCRREEAEAAGAAGAAILEMK